MSQFSNVEEALDFLQENMKANSMPASSANAAQYLGASGDERILGPLLNALEYGGDYIRATAASALGQLGRAEAVPALTAAFVNDTAVYVRSDAVLALGRLGLE